MKLGLHALALILGFGLVAPALAQEETKKEEPAKEEAAAPTPAAEPAPAAAPEATPAKDEAAAPAAAPAAAAAPAKELSGCAKSFSQLAESYKSAYDDLQKWIAQIDTATAAAGDKVQKLQAQIHENESAITQAKLNKDNAKAKDLQKENKKLWDDFNAAQKGQSDACAKFVKEAPQRVKQYSDATNKALDALKAQTK
jgi:chromosome segregation ATPase